MSPLVPRPPIDRAALERVLARASELQAQGAGTDTDGAMSDDQILDLGKEVGLTPDTLRQALAEERGRVAVPRAASLGGGWLGSGSLAASRIVPGTPASVLTAVDAALREELSFDVKRRFPDRILWEPRRTFLDTMRQQFQRSGEATYLRNADEVGALVVPVDAQRTHVSVEALIATARSRAATLSFAATGLGAAGAMIAAFEWVPAIGIPLYAGAVGLVLYYLRSRFRAEALRVATALEQLLDRLEFGPTPRKPRSIVDKLLG